MEVICVWFPEEEESGVPEGERDGEEEEGEEAQVGAADARVEHDAVVVLGDNFE